MTSVGKYMYMYICILKNDDAFKLQTQPRVKINVWHRHVSIITMAGNSIILISITQV